MIRKLTEIRLADATKRDFARAINYSMKKSKRTANVLVGKLDLHGGVTPRTLDKMYPKDTFHYRDERLMPKAVKSFAEDINEILDINKPANEINLMDYSNAIIRTIVKR